MSAIFFFIIREAWPILPHVDWGEFFFENRWLPNPAEGNEAKYGAAGILYFGVACLTDASKTKTGTVLGSPYYMSPEQLSGKKVDGRADLFSLGVTLYQMLSGELPFQGDSIANLMYNIANEPHPDIRRFRSGLPNCIPNLINKALQKEATGRFQSGIEMAAAMKRCQEHIREMEAA